MGTARIRSPLEPLTSLNVAVPDVVIGATLRSAVTVVLSQAYMGL
jgi:hypothetical protein